MWIYYNAIYGPGHQSGDDGFKYFANHHDSESIKEHLFDMFSHQYSVVLRFWQVDAPPDEFIKDRIKAQKKKIKSEREYLKMLEGTNCSCLESVDGEDKTLKNNLKERDNGDIIRRLHKAGLMYTDSDLSDWWYGKKTLTEPTRSKVLNIMRRTKKYSSAK